MSVIPWISLVIAVACTVIFLVEVASGALENENKLVRIGAMQGEKVRAGEWWRLVSPAFLHGSPSHLIGNLMMLYILGIGCEHAFGRGQFLLLFLLTAIGGSLGSALHGHVSVGASGAIFGMAGALVSHLWRYRGAVHVRDNRIALVIGFWAIYQVALGVLDPVVDNNAHIGGFLIGLALGLVFRPRLLLGAQQFRALGWPWLAGAIAVLGFVSAGAFFLPRVIEVA